MAPPGGPRGGGLREQVQAREPDADARRAPQHPHVDGDQRRNEHEQQKSRRPEERHGSLPAHPRDATPPASSRRPAAPTKNEETSVFRVSHPSTRPRSRQLRFSPCVAEYMK